MSRSDFICSKCEEYKDPQGLDYVTGQCFDCQDGVIHEMADSDLLEKAKPSKMYILIMDDVPVGHAINSAAHASLACYVKFAHLPDMQNWLNESFKKVTCKVTKEQFFQAQNIADKYIVITESALDHKVMAIAFAPRETWDPFFKTLALWS